MGILKDLLDLRRLRTELTEARAELEALRTQAKAEEDAKIQEIITSVETQFGKREAQILADQKAVRKTKSACVDAINNIIPLLEDAKLPKTAQRIRQIVHDQL